MTRQQDVQPLAALMAAFASMAQVARRNGPGPRKRGRRTAVQARSTRGGRDRRTDANLRAFLDTGWVHSRRPADYVAAGIVVGWTGAFALVALGRAVRGRPDGGPGSTQLRSGLVRLRRAAMRATRQRPQHPSGAGAPQQGDRDEIAGVTAIPAPATASTPAEFAVADTAGRPARHISGAA
jgi:hypothetical protein